MSERPGLVSREINELCKNDGRVMAHGMGAMGMLGSILLGIIRIRLFSF